MVQGQARSRGKGSRAAAKADAWEKGEQALFCQSPGGALTACELGNGTWNVPFPDRARTLPRETSKPPGQAARNAAAGFAALFRRRDQEVVGPAVTSTKNRRSAFAGLRFFAERQSLDVRALGPKTSALSREGLPRRCESRCVGKGGTSRLVKPRGTQRRALRLCSDAGGRGSCRHLDHTKRS